MRSRRRFLRDSARLAGAAVSWPRLTRAQDRATEFDYVIVGGGSAGCVLANRLSADRRVQVLVVEAGPADVNPLIHAPGSWTSLLESDVDWNYLTEAEPGLGGRRLKWPRGKTIGGSSAINAMAYVRGHPRCFDSWAAEAGSAWRFQEVLPLFKSMEDNSRGQAEYSGAGGPLTVSETTDPHAGHLAFLEAAREHGFGADPRWDFNGAQQDGVAAFYQKNIRGGRRHSAADAFLTPVLARGNLVVWSSARVHRLVMTRRRVHAVDVAHGTRVERIGVRREVILAAGVVESPKILMLSGIGPAAALRRHGISVTADLPGVGANLHDHPRVSMRWAATQPLAPSSVSAGLFFASGKRPQSDAPDLQFYVGRGLNAPDPFITLTVALSQPLSRGSVSLQSANPETPPAIQSRYFREASDLEALLEGVRVAQALGQARAYAGLRGAPADPEMNAASADRLRAYIRRAADTIFHPVGTCRMGTGSSAVVDGQLRVRGVEGVRVADASVMPTSVNSQTQAACLMIAEQAARFIERASGSAAELR